MTTQWTGPVDLDNCAREPIHVPGAIQPHGVFLALAEPGLDVTVASENLGSLVATDAADALGRPVSEVLGPRAADQLDVARGEPWRGRFDTEVDVNGRSLLASLHRTDGHLVVELEQESGDVVPSSLLRDAALAMSHATDLVGVADEAARTVRSLSGFDRVMVYRFDAEWNGEVIAEQKADWLNSYLGLHYPATDIPAQARELYRRNWIRLISDIGYTPVPLLPPVAFDASSPLDLSGSTLRSVSPIHVEYLQNMGVTASMSLSLIVGGELWGLVACHHYSGVLRPDVAVRNVAEHIAQLASVRLGEVEAAERKTRATELGEVVQRLAEALASSPHWAVAQTLGEQEGDVLKVADATGAVVMDGPRRITLGDVPRAEVLDEILRAWTVRSEAFVTDHLAGRLGADVGPDDGAAGVLGVSLTFDAGTVVLWFRPELVRTVDWGGDPHNAKLAVQEGDSVRLSPRKSFEKWQEVVEGRSMPWSAAEVQSAHAAARLIGGAMLRRDRVMATMATDLQQAMLPASLPTVAGLRFDGRSIPDGRGIVGGDWYDVFDVGDGRLAIVVGDMAGHGLPAASAMAQVRNALRAYVLDEPSLPSAMARLDRLVRRLLPGDMATAVMGVLDPTDLTLELSSAGHLDPLLVRDGVASFLPASRNTVLGFQSSRSDVTRHRLLPGDVLALYSDGLVESRRTPLDDRLDILLGTGAALVSASLTDLSGRLIEEMTAEERSDDVTVLTVVVEA